MFHEGAPKQLRPLPRTDRPTACCHISDGLVDFLQYKIFLLTVHHLYGRGKKTNCAVKVTGMNNLSSITSFSFLIDPNCQSLADFY